MKQVHPRREDLNCKEDCELTATRMALTAVQTHLLTLAVATKLLLYPA